jgi:hypothetical protein
MKRAAAVPLLAVGILAALGAAGRGPASAVGGAPGPSRPAARVSSAFQLFASARSTVRLSANRVECTINSVGEQCSDANNSSVYGGGFWPSGTGDQYIFNGGLQIAAIVPGDRAAFGWAGDTVGAYIFDARGDQAAGAAVTDIYDSRDPADLANWPSAAYVRDTALFDASLIGRKAASEQDSWVRYSDASPYLVGRRHAMGLLVDQRTLAWNRPEAGRDVLFVVMRIINVTARDRARYAGLAAAGYTPDDIAEIAKLGAAYHARSDTAGVNLPDTGFTWTNLYVGMGQDPDVGNSGRNYSTAVLPFATAIAYQADFIRPSWAYPPEIFGPPFRAAPGLAGTKFLRAGTGPVTGSSIVRMFTNTTGGAPFPDRVGVAALWRMLSNHLLPADGSCNAPLGTPLCELVQVSQDTRWNMSSGPWPDVAGGQSVVFVIAYVFAAPLAAALQTDGQGHALGSAFFDLMPGFPATGPRLAAGPDTVRQIERAAGWTNYADANGNGDIEQREVRVQPLSLLGKAAAAQALADNKFVLAAPPAAPRFYPLPGDGQVTVVWERSASEVIGDPYFAVAADPLSALYDPNYRQYDVEGYRVWRGRTLASLQAIAQFDYTGTALVDHTGQVFAWNVSYNCAPELGLVAGCGADFLHGGTVAVPLAGPVVQVPLGGRALLASGEVATFHTDTAVTGGGSGRSPLMDTRVPFAYVDTGLENGTTYVYAVTAFDVNSVNSGPTSLESELVGRTVTPRVASSNAHGATVELRLEGGDGSRLDPSKDYPAIDPNDGTFSGPIPPANGGSIWLPVTVQELLPAGTFSLVVDSVSPGFADGTAGAPAPSVWFSALGASAATRGSVPITGVSTIGGTSHYEYPGPLVPYDSVQAQRFGVRFGADARMAVRFTGVATGLSSSSPGAARAAVNGYGTAVSRYLSHSRWFDEGGREPPDPTLNPYASARHTNGALTGVSAIFSPLPYRLPWGASVAAPGIPSGYRVLLSATLSAWHPADFVVRWGAGGQVTVTDLTHRTAVPYKGAIQPGYGFLNVAALVAAGVTSADLGDGTAGRTFDPAVASYYSLRTIAPVCTSALRAPCVPLQQAAQLQPVDVTNDGVADGTGIALLVDGEPFFFLMSALPAAGTAWRLRAVGGAGMTATCSPALTDASSDLLPANVPTDCWGYAFVPPPTRPAYVPGLRYSVVVTRQFGADTSAYGGLALVHTVPDPFYFTNAVALGAAPAIRFVNLPERAVIRIYSASGILVTVLTHNDATAGGEEVWDVKNRSGRYVASGVYFYHVEAPDHRTKIGRLTVVQQAWP